MINDTTGPIIRWDSYGVEGWKPKSFSSIEEAITKDLYGNDYVLTRVVEFTIVETTSG